MEITDKDRLDFIERNFFEIFRYPYENKEWGCCDGYCNDFFGNNLREAIDNAIMAMREKDK